MDKFRTHETMRDIYDRLSEIGFQPKFVRDCILPDWWEDRLADVPANRAYAEAVIARQLGLELANLRNKDARLERRPGVALRLKHRQGVTDDEMQVAITLGERLACIAATSTEQPVILEGVSALSIRKAILCDGASWVGFSELLEFCWSIGIPVVSLCCRLPGSKKPDGMAIWTQERPVIVVASGKKQPAWHLFILAHELGHIVLGHLAKGQLSVDSQVRLEAADAEEEAANAFAVELLSGAPDLCFSPPKYRINAQQLADSAASIGRKYRIDPGFIALNYSRSQGFMPLGTSALNKLSPGADACSLYRDIYSRLNLDDLSEDNRHVFECLTEVA